MQYKYYLQTWLIDVLSPSRLWIFLLVSKEDILLQEAILTHWSQFFPHCICGLCMNGLFCVSSF